MHDLFANGDATAGSYGAAVLVTFVVRLASRPLSQGSIVGQVIDVASGERTAIHDANDLLCFLRRHAVEESAGPSHQHNGG
jgi:hypothetical protein